MAGNEPTLTNHKHQVVTVLSTKSVEKLIQGHGFLFLKDGSVSGIPASLLNEGASRGMDEIVLFVSRTRLIFMQQLLFQNQLVD
jgi:predicted ATP-grasp superfamily ATP-dependent carboligase